MKRFSKILVTLLVMAMFIGIFAAVPAMAADADLRLKMAQLTVGHYTNTALTGEIVQHCANSDYKKEDGKKVMASFGLGAVFVLLFLATFYGIYTTLAPRQHYAFSKIAQYFSALKTVGRVDLLLVYLLTAILLLTTILPILLCCFCLQSVFGEGLKLPFSIGINGGLLLFTLYCNKYYNLFYKVFTNSLWWVFPAFSVGLPLLFLLLLINKNKSSHKGKSKGKIKKRGINYAR